MMVVFSLLYTEFSIFEENLSEEKLRKAEGNER